MKRVLIIENDSYIDDEVETIIQHLYDDDDCQIKEVTYAQSNGSVILATAKAYSSLTTKDDEFIILGMSTFGDHDQILSVLKAMKSLPNLPTIQFVFAEQFLNKLQEGKSWMYSEELIELCKFFVDKGLVEDVYVRSKSDGTYETEIKKLEWDGSSSK